MIENLKGKGVKFGEGQSTNKGGSPKGKRIATILKELLGKNAKEFSKNKAFVDLDGNTALAMELVLMAFSKDDSPRDKLNAIKEILDRIEGKSVQHNIIEEKKPITGIQIEDI
jgi:hypothetical protein